MPLVSSVLSALRAQDAPESHLKRVADLVELAARDPALLAIFLVGSYAKGTGDRISDLDLVAIAAPGQERLILDSAHSILGRAEVLNEFSGNHATGGSFWKLVYLDFSSVEFHVFEPDTTFRLKRPHLTVWDPSDLLTNYVVDGEPIRHEDFAAYEYGDEGLIWELVDCIKWLKRSRSDLAKHHLEKIAIEIKKCRLGTGSNSAA
jgi:predicted nucleotidyltransferase